MTHWLLFNQYNIQININTNTFYYQNIINNHYLIFSFFIFNRCVLYNLHKLIRIYFSFYLQQYKRYPYKKTIIYNSFKTTYFYKFFSLLQDKKYTFIQESGLLEYNVLNTLYQLKSKSFIRKSNNIKRQYSGRISRNKGFLFQTKVVKKLQQNLDLTYKIIKIYLYHREKIMIHDNNEIIIINIYENKEIEKKLKKKISFDVFIQFKYKYQEFYIKIDTKYSKSISTQLCAKKIHLFHQKYYNLLKKYTQYYDKERLWIKSSDMSEIKKQIQDFFIDVSYDWIVKRFLKNELYHNDFILSKSYQLIDIQSILKDISNINFVLKKTNIIVQYKNIDFLSIKPHGSRTSDNLQLHIYKSIFRLENLLIKNNF